MLNKAIQLNGATQEKINSSSTAGDKKILIAQPEWIFSETFSKQKIQPGYSPAGLIFIFDLILLPAAFLYAGGQFFIKFSRIDERFQIQMHPVFPVERRNSGNIDAFFMRIFSADIFIDP